jgi:hypothetical protein
MGNKTLSDLAASHGDKIATWYKDSDGYWLTLHYGWQRGGTHAVHELTVREVLASFRDVEPCDCIECKTQGEQFEEYDYDTKTWIIRNRGSTDDR